MWTSASRNLFGTNAGISAICISRRVGVSSPLLMRQNRVAGRDDRARAAVPDVLHRLEIWLDEAAVTVEDLGELLAAGHRSLAHLRALRLVGGRLGQVGRGRVGVGLLVFAHTCTVC